MQFSTEAVVVTVLLYPAYNAFCLLCNYLEARKIGLPIIILPCSPTNLLSFIFSDFVHSLLRRIGLGRLLRFRHLGWEFHEKSAPHLEMGSAILLVAPDKIWMEVGDPDGITQIIQGERKGIFGRPAESIKMLDVFGPNISTAVGDNWVRMRRITASSFNDNTNKAVWNESVRQGTQMLTKWLAAGDAGVSSTADDTRQFALNVMLGAGFGKVYDFDVKAEGKAMEKHINSMDYRQALKLVLENAMLIIGIGPEVVPKLSVFSKSLATIGKAVATYQQYMTDVFSESTTKANSGSSTSKDSPLSKAKGNLLETLVRASVENGQLSQREVYGNMFVYMFGGHDSTAHSLAFTFVLLSIHPEVQDWMREELREVLKDEDPSSWSLNDFAKLKRIQAVQLEVLRLYNPLLGISKGTNGPVQLTLEGGKRTVTIPGDVRITLNINGIHSHPEYWGADASEWRPSRFISVDATTGEEQIVTHPKGQLLPWSDGLRSCPGKKFGQVEHTALMATVFYGYRVEALREAGESVEEMRTRIMGVIKDSGMVLNVQMRHPEKAKLVWSRV